MTHPVQISQAARNGSEGSRKYGRNGTGPGRDVKDSGSVGAIIWQQELGGDWRDDQGPFRVPPSVRVKDHGDDKKKRGKRRMRIPIGKGGDGSRGAPPRVGVHQEPSEKNIREDGLPPHLYTVYGGGADDGDEPAGAMVGSRRGK